MPSVQDILQAYAQGQIVGAGPGGASSGGLSFIPPLIGLIRPHLGPAARGKGDQAPPTPQFIDFARPEYCSLWVPIPTALIENIDLLGKRPCDGLFYDYVRITFKLPVSDEGKLLAGLLLQSQQAKQTCECEEKTTRRRPECVVCKNITKGYDDLVSALKKAKDHGAFGDKAGCKSFCDNRAAFIAYLTDVLGIGGAVLDVILLALDACGHCACDYDVF